MNNKLRSWIEGWCRPGPGGAWLVEVPVLQTKAVPTFELRDGVSKDAYVDRAVRLGGFHLMSQFALAVGFTLFMAFCFAVSALGMRGTVDLRSMFGVLSVAPHLVPAAFLVWAAAVYWKTGRLREWLRQAGTEVSSDVAPDQGRRSGRGKFGRAMALRRCRPGYMVAGEAVAFGAFGLSSLLIAFELRSGCLRIVERWQGSATASLPNCSANFSWFVLIIALQAALAAATSWDWWRWNKRRVELR